MKTHVCCDAQGVAFFAQYLCMCCPLCIILLTHASTTSVIFVFSVPPLHGPTIRIPRPGATEFCHGQVAKLFKELKAAMAEGKLLLGKVKSDLAFKAAGA